MPAQQARKSVQWSTITVYEFGVAMGGSAVPKHGGPAIGLAKKPKRVWKTSVKDVLQLCPLHDGGVEEALAPLSLMDQRDKSKRMCCCRKEKRGQPRNRRVRWFKPLERISMLEKAGYSEKKIYRMLMESSDIAMSRRLCLRVPVERSSRSQV
ncbi:hypothetical protein PINS_up005645 [Pythium insidiosum]|nr:hypothetical protein PINS_up005645 [Pythium insidiosum]